MSEAPSQRIIVGVSITVIAAGILWGVGWVYTTIGDQEDKIAGLQAQLSASSGPALAKRLDALELRADAVDILNEEVGKYLAEESDNLDRTSERMDLLETGLQNNAGSINVLKFSVDKLEKSQGGEWEVLFSHGPGAGTEAWAGEKFNGELYQYRLMLGSAGGKEAREVHPCVFADSDILWFLRGAGTYISVDPNSGRRSTWLAMRGGGDTSSVVWSLERRPW